MRLEHRFHRCRGLVGGGVEHLHRVQPQAQPRLRQRCSGNIRPATHVQVHRPGLGKIGREQLGVVPTMMEAHRRQLPAHPEVVLQEVLLVHLGGDRLQRAVRQRQDARVEAGNRAIDADRRAAGASLHVAGHGDDGARDDPVQMGDQVRVVNQVDEIVLSAQVDADVHQAVQRHVASQVAELRLEGVHQRHEPPHRRRLQNVLRNLQRPDLRFAHVALHDRRIAILVILDSAA